MSTKRQIGRERWWMYLLALVLDAVQLATPATMDISVVFMAIIIFGMIFLERGILTSGGSTWLKIIRFVMPVVEFMIGNVPGIFLIVWAQIKASDIKSATKPSVAPTRNVIKGLQYIMTGMRYKQKTVARRRPHPTATTYGKGRRGERTLARKTKAPSTSQTSRVQRTLDREKVV